MLRYARIGAYAVHATGADSLDAAKTRLGPEPDETKTGVTTLMFRLPDGQQVVRRFLGSRPTQDAFDFLETHGCAPGTYDMVRVCLMVADRI